MNVPSVLEPGGVEGKFIWHLTEIKKGLMKKGTLPTEYICIPFPNIKVSWRQSKQGKGWSRAEKDLLLNLLGQPFQQNGCPVCTVEVAEGLWKRLGPLWEIFHKGLVQCALGRKCLMIVM
jgi:hypothetical protein